MDCGVHPSRRAGWAVGCMHAHALRPPAYSWGAAAAAGTYPPALNTRWTLTRGTECGRGPC